MKNYKDVLRQNNQEHLLKYIEKANDEQREKLISQINELNFDLINKLYKMTINSKPISSKEIGHLKYVDESKLEEQEYNKLFETGKELISKGKCAVVTMAGGQGTRLGHNGPKGTFLLEVKPQPKYLFEIIVDDLKRTNKKFGTILNWYIMTSTDNNQKTVDFFEEHNYFGYPKENVMFFMQGNLPLIDEQGKLLVDENYEIKIASDGNGSIYKSMKKNGVIDDMKKKGIEWIFVSTVDNPLIQRANPILLGLTVSEGNEIGSRSVVKKHPHEPVGVYCKKDNAPAVIEYSEISKEMAEETDENGELIFGETNIVSHLYSVKALDKIGENELQYHTAHKKASFMNEDGEMVYPEEPNAYKYESFIFDGFSFFDNMSILRSKREDIFAPIKNKEGEDSPETAIKLYNDYWNS